MKRPRPFEDDGHKILDINCETANRNVGYIYIYIYTHLLFGGGFIAAVGEDYKF